VGTTTAWVTLLSTSRLAAHIHLRNAGQGEDKWYRAGPPAVTWLGVALWAVGFGFETVGDLQLRRFRADPANAGQVPDRGPWRYTRHPNYVGDAVVWFGLWLLACSHWLGALVVISPVYMTNMLVRHTGNKLLEKHVARSKITRTLMDAVPAGSYLAVAHPASDVDQEVAPALRQLGTRMGGTRVVPRSQQQIARFFDGLEMVQPGLVQLHRWRPGPGVPDSGRDLAAYGGVGRRT
jgi:protein-S-isoprenylcysteine O-methyltransferase Ste14